MAHFSLYFKTDALRERLAPLLSQIPPFFSFSLSVDTPTVQILPASDPTWSGFPMPIADSTAYVFDDVIPARAVGGASGTHVGVRVCEGDSDEVLILRLWHELLHAVGQPADDMVSLADKWQTPIERLLWAVWPYLCGSLDVPFWHRRYYTWLTERAAVEET